MITPSTMPVVNVTGLNFVDDGRSFQMEVVDSVKPVLVTRVTFRNTFHVKISQVGGEGYPLVILDLKWWEVPPDEQDQLLTAHGYPLSNQDGLPLRTMPRMVVAEWDGDLVGSVIAEGIAIESRPIQQTDE